jgi:hypothetical protein
VGKYDCKTIKKCPVSNKKGVDNFYWAEERGDKIAKTATEISVLKDEWEGICD